MLYAMYPHLRGVGSGELSTLLQNTDIGIFAGTSGAESGFDSMHTTFPFCSGFSQFGYGATLSKYARHYKLNTEYNPRPRRCT